MNSKRSFFIPFIVLVAVTASVGNTDAETSSDYVETPVILKAEDVLAGIDHGLAAAMSISATAEGMRRLVRDNPPGELRKINKKKLEDLGIDPSLAQAFLDNNRFNPQEGPFWWESWKR